MKGILKIVVLSCCVLLSSCTELRKGDDSSEKAADANKEKFKDNKAKQDAEFVGEVVASNYAEIKMAELANQRSRNAEVKQVAQMLLADHSSALNELKTIAQAKAISVPVQEDDNAKRKLESFTQNSGKEFDEKWCKDMMETHEESIDAFEKRMENSDDAELKSWISKTLPLLRTHHDKLKACHKKLQEKKS